MNESCSAIVRLLKEKERILIMAGDLCSRLEINGKPLGDYVVILSKKTGAPVAATGNSIGDLTKTGIVTKKMWAAEIVNYLHRSWQEDISVKKPQVLVLIGYNPEIARRLIGAAHGVVETIFLGTKSLAEATLSLPDSKLEELGTRLEEILNDL